MRKYVITFTHRKYQKRVLVSRLKGIFARGGMCVRTNKTTLRNWWRGGRTLIRNGKTIKLWLLFVIAKQALVYLVHNKRVWFVWRCVRKLSACVLLNLLVHNHPNRTKELGTQVMVWYPQERIDLKHLKEEYAWNKRCHIWSSTFDTFTG